jgi:fatty acid kinase fatty acid binding subunit
MVVKIVVDSAADIGAERAVRYGITIVPVTVSFGDVDYRNGVDIDNPTFYQMLQKSPVFPGTAAPGSASFEDAYRAAIREGATAILSMHLSGALSGTFNSASLAAANIRKETSVPIEVMDSRTISGGFGLPAMLAAEFARSGASLEEVTAFARDLIDRGKLFIILDTLTYLQRGGRIGKASAFVGTMLDVKPILSIKDGEIVPIERVRSRKKALACLTDLMRSAGPIEFIALTVSDKVLTDEFTAAIRLVYTGHIEEFELSPALGAHAGPLAGGVFVFAKA